MFRILIFTTFSDVEILTHGFVAMMELFRTATALGPPTVSAPKVPVENQPISHVGIPMADVATPTDQQKQSEYNRGLDITNYLTVSV